MDAAPMPSLAPDVTWADALQAWASLAAAILAFLTVAAAVWAGRAAWRQVKQAQDLRREQAQPYVVVYAEPSRVRQHYIDVVIENFGTTAARDLSIKTTPSLVRTNPGGGEGIETVHLPDGAPLIAPRQAWRTLWDYGPRREKTELPDRCEVSVSYTDSYGTRHTTDSVLDWSFFRGRMYVGEKNINDVVGQLEQLAKALSQIVDRE